MKTNHLSKGLAVVGAVVLIAAGGVSQAATRTEPGDPGTYAVGAVAATTFYAEHVALMAKRHPGAHLVKSGYQNGSSDGDLWTGEQIAVQGAPACWLPGDPRARQQGHLGVVRPEPVAMNPAERATVYGLSRDGSYFVTMDNVNQCTEQLPDAPGRWYIDLALLPRQPKS